MGAHVEIWSVRIVVAAQLFGQDASQSDNDGDGYIPLTVFPEVIIETPAL